MGMSGLGRIGKTRVEKGSSATVPLNWKVLGTLLFNTVISFFLSLKMFFSYIFWFDSLLFDRERNEYRTEC